MNVNPHERPADQQPDGGKSNAVEPGNGSTPHLSNVAAGRDILVSESGIHVTNYEMTLRHLRPHPVDRTSVLSETLFVEPQVRHDGDPSSDVPDVSTVEPMPNIVRVLLGPEKSGRRTAALRMLDAMLPEGRRIFELFPDWEEPDVARIPCEPNTGYVLNLAGIQEQLGDTFQEQLHSYAQRAALRGTRLIIIGDDLVWHRTHDGRSDAPVAVLTIKRPDARKIAQRRISADPLRTARVAWLHDSQGVFAGLLKGNEPPGDGVRLAEIVLQADSSRAPEARDRFLDWPEQLKSWFAGSDEGVAERRALQIAAAFLDGSPAVVVLGAADELLADSEVNWPARVGGPLSGGDDTQRCAGADVEFEDDGTVSITRPRPGIDRALLRRVWRYRPQLVPVLTRWLGEISKPGGVAEGCLPRLAESVTYIAEAEGPATVLGLVSDWLLTGKARHVDLAVDVLGRLACDPQLGAAVRKELGAWAKQSSRPERQRAVVAVCRGELSTAYTSIALTRLRYVLDRARDPQTTGETVDVLRVLLQHPLLSARVLQALTEWAASADNDAPSREAFLRVFTPRGTGETWDLPSSLLTAAGRNGRTIRQILQNGLRTLWRRNDARTTAAVILGDWCDAADAGLLPADAVEEIVTVVFAEQADALGDDLDRVIGGATEFRRRLRSRFVDVVRETAARRSASDTGQAA
ncbi:hypothetical protein ACFVJK_28295 [Streptomyces sp. NPDC127172]|uniref:hypothetical protein n=1 Tax=Streptomyces sp. NPDC127172 TaxID=3345382 RepID=UPI00363DB15E